MAPPGYLFVFGHSLAGEKMARYSAALPPIYEKYGGFYLGIGGPGRGVEHLEGEWFDHSMVLARFNTPNDVTKFWFSTEYEEAKKLRKDGGEFSVFKMTDNDLEAPEGEPAFLVSVYRVLDADTYAPSAQAEEDKLAQRDIPIITHASYDETERLEGDLIDHDFSIAAFPTQAAATNFWNDPGFKELREARA
jgi:uncharacterized protein (DUF1330 family)